MVHLDYGGGLLEGGHGGQGKCVPSLNPAIQQLLKDIAPLMKRCKG